MWYIFCFAFAFWASLSIADTTICYCDQDSTHWDSTIESLAGSFVNEVWNLKYIGQGAKNSVFGHPLSPFILRIAFVHNAQCVLTGNIIPALRMINVNRTSNLTMALHESIINLKYNLKRNVIDIMSATSLSEELLQSVLTSSVPGLIFGVNTAIARAQLCVDDSRIRVVHMKVNSPCELKLPLRLNVEISRLFNGSVSSLAEHHSLRPEFSAMDVLVLAFGYVHDLGQMIAHHNWFPTDAHPGNLLYNRTGNGTLSFAWHDFGHTISESRIDAQIQSSIQQTIDMLFEILKHPLRTDESPPSSPDISIDANAVSEVIRVLRLPSLGESSRP
jgi:hypothetical protein